MDRLTYAHLFTLSPLIASPPLPTADDLRESYLALGPIPNGKRCLLVTGPKGITRFSLSFRRQLGRN